MCSIDQRLSHSPAPPGGRKCSLFHSNLLPPPSPTVFLFAHLSDQTYVRLKLPPPTPAKPVPEMAVVPTPPHDFRGRLLARLEFQLGLFAIRAGGPGRLALTGCRWSDACAVPN